MNAPVPLVDVLVVGAGPAGLATAIAARRAGLSHLVLEKGVVVNSIYHFPTHMVFFTTAELLELGELPFVTPYEKPTRFEALRYYRRVVDAFRLEVRTGEAVKGIHPETDGTGARPFAIESRTERGSRRTWRARFVVLATGVFDWPNALGVPGEDLPHVSHYYREAHPYYRKEVVVVGGKNSAAEAALELYRAGASVTLVHRGPALGDSVKYWVRPDIENRIREGAIRARFETRVVEIRPASVMVECAGRRDELPADAVLLLTGHHPDTTLFERAGIRYDPVTLVPAVDPDTLESNVEGLFLAGSVISGRHAGRIFIENGRFHGEQVIRAIAQRMRARVRAGS